MNDLISRQINDSFDSIERICFNPLELELFLREKPKYPYVTRRIYDDRISINIVPFKACGSLINETGFYTKDVELAQVVIGVGDRCLGEYYCYLLAAGFEEKYFSASITSWKVGSGGMIPYRGLHADIPLQDPKDITAKIDLAHRMAKLGKDFRSAGTVTDLQTFKNRLNDLFAEIPSNPNRERAIESLRNRLSMNKVEANTADNTCS
ncbi:MAG: hypothetical protein WC464_07485 [Bdellovibrionales bacterium]